MWSIGTHPMCPKRLRKPPYPSGTRHADDTPMNATHILGQRPRVLVADDDDDLRALVVPALRSDGYDLIEARDGAALVEIMTKSTPPDAVVTDICMPGASGLSILDELRKAGCMTPIVVITAYGGEHTRALAERLGANATFQKPFDIDDLRTVVMHLLQATSRSREVAITLPDSSEVGS
jgi:two-component system response regulator (stage 0 sporulation protein F)